MRRITDLISGPDLTLSEEALSSGPRLKRKNVFLPHAGPNMFDEERQRESLTQCGDPLVELDAMINWSIFRPLLLTLYKKDEKQKSLGRKPVEPLLMFKILILQRLYNLADDPMEFAIRDRASFQRFLGIYAGDGSPDSKTIWLFRERLSENDTARKLFDLFDATLLERGFVARAGQMIDASFVEAPRQHNTREENEKIKAGETPEWPAHKAAQKDLDGTYAKKNEETHYGYKNTVNADAEAKIIRAYEVTTASPHDSQMFHAVLLPYRELNLVFADSAYRSAEIETLLSDLKFESHIHERAYRNTPLTEEQKARNTKKSETRARIEHVFGNMFTRKYRGAHILCIGLARAKTVIGLENLLYNLRRFISLAAGRAVLLSSFKPT